MPAGALGPKVPAGISPLAFFFLIGGKRGRRRGHRWRPAGPEGAAREALGTPWRPGCGVRVFLASCSAPRHLAGRCGLQVCFIPPSRFRRRVGTAEPRRTLGQRRQGAGVALAAGRTAALGEESAQPRAVAGPRVGLPCDPAIRVLRCSSPKSCGWIQRPLGCRGRREVRGSAQTSGQAVSSPARPSSTFRAGISVD